MFGAMYPNAIHTTPGKGTCHRCDTLGVRRLQLDVEYDAQGLVVRETVIWVCENHIGPQVPHPGWTRNDCPDICGPEHCGWPTCKEAS